MGGVIAASLLIAAPWLGGWFTDDPAVAETVTGVVAHAALMQPLSALVFVADGVLMAVLAGRLLATSTGVALVAAAAVLWVSAALGGGLAGVWWAIITMMVARFCVFLWGGRRGLAKWIGTTAR